MRACLQNRLQVSRVEVSLDTHQVSPGIPAHHCPFPPINALLFHNDSPPHFPLLPMSALLLHQVCTLPYKAARALTAQAAATRGTRAAGSPWPHKQQPPLYRTPIVRGMFNWPHEQPPLYRTSAAARAARAAAAPQHYKQRWAHGLWRRPPCYSRSRRSTAAAVQPQPALYSSRSTAAGGALQQPQYSRRRRSTAAAVQPQAALYSTRSTAAGGALLRAGDSGKRGAGLDWPKMKRQEAQQKHFLLLCSGGRRARASEE